MLELLVLVTGLYLAAIALLSEGEVEVMADIADPVSLPGLTSSPSAASMYPVSRFLQRGMILTHCYSS